jgi:hypothetical protein
MITIEWRESKQFRGVIEAHGVPRWLVRGWKHRWLLWIETRPHY